MNRLSSKIDDLIINIKNGEDTFNFYKLQIEELKKSLNVLTIKIKDYEH